MPTQDTRAHDYRLNLKGHTLMDTLVVHIEGGLVTDIRSSDPTTDLRVIVVDHDTEGASIGDDYGLFVIGDNDRVWITKYTIAALEPEDLDVIKLYTGR